ncbi:hypothetical protein CTAYLR_006205 [Chrysophaeum taylorii]|uniref:Uncharacterized protein n=1 Tax=Chrysophaeum taylorii TaxID=2483200 RepID=A0AAD7XI40_9STRA|nr:hypothetical protein CTAYLR_006205 [Chrysophaeum taylorii]
MVEKKLWLEAAERVIAELSDEEVEQVRRLLAPAAARPSIDPRLEDQRSKILDEIVSTEEFYVKCLEILVFEYAHALFDSTYDKAIVPMEQVFIIFSNVEDILLVNRELLSQLRERPEEVGKIFLNMSFALRLYSRYIVDYDAARSCLAEVENSDKFQKFVEGVEAKKSEGSRVVSRQSLQSLMIMPVQRIPRYELLLRELLKVSRQLDEECEELEAALEAVRSVAEENNERIRATESKAKLYDLQKRFVKCADLVGPRFFIKEGPMRKVHGRGGIVVECRMILLSDVLIYAQHSKLEGKKLEVHRRVLLGDAATQFQDLEDGQFENQIAVLNSEKSMIFLCADAKDKAEWFAALTDARNKARSEDKEEDDKVAMTLWEHDAPRCTITSVKFTTLIRRHHCRVNGECVSADASRARFKLHELGDRFGEERVCDWCARDFTLLGSWPRVVKNKLELRESIGGFDETTALDFIKPKFQREDEEDYCVMGSWVWKKGGVGTKDSKQRALFGRRNWKKRWMELRRDSSSSETSFQLSYFDEPNSVEKGRISLGSAILLKDDTTPCAFVVKESLRDYQMRLLDEGQPATPLDFGQYKLWISAIRHAITLSHTTPTSPQEEKEEGTVSSSSSSSSSSS